MNWFQSLYGEAKNPVKGNTILKVKNKVGGLMLPDFNTYYKVIGINTVWCYVRVPPIFPHLLFPPGIFLRYAALKGHAKAV